MSGKKIGRWLLFPAPALMMILVPFALGLLIYAAAACDSTDPVSIASYVLSFYALVIVCVRVPAILRRLKQFRQENRFVRRYLEDAGLRINLSLQLSFGFHTAYAAFQLCLGLWHHSVWFYSMAGYHLLLAGMRLLLVRYTKSHQPGEQQEIEWKKYRLCGVLLLLTTLALTVFCLYFIWKIRVFWHHEITTIAMAAYTFAALGMAIINAVRARRSGSPVWSAARNIALASAAVSMLTLENAMLTAFGQENSEIFHRIMLGATGAAVFLTVQGIAVYMIVNAGKNLKKREIKP